LRLTTHAEAVEAAHRVAEVWAPGVIDRDRAGAYEIGDVLPPNHGQL
jgi:hypothetical protein